MRTNIKDVTFSITGNGEFVPYCNFRIIDKFITYLKKNGLLDDFSYQDLLNFLSEQE